MIHILKLSLSERWKLNVATEPIHALLLGAGALFALLLFIQLPSFIHLPRTLPADFLPYIFSRGLLNSEPEEPFFFRLGIILFPFISLLFWRFAIVLLEKIFKGLSDQIIMHALSFRYASGLFLGSCASLAIFFIIIFLSHARIVSFIAAITFFFGAAVANHVFLRSIAHKVLLARDGKEKNAYLRVAQKYAWLLVFIIVLAFFLFFVWFILSEYIKQYAFHILLFIILLCVAGTDYRLLHKRISFPKPWQIGLELLLIGILIPLLLWNPHFRHQVGFGGTALYHFNFFLGPVNDILHGKLLMVNTESQYGIFLTYGLAFLFRYLVPFTYANFYIVVMAVSIFYYWSLYVLLRAFTRSIRWSLIGFFTVFCVHLLAITALFPPHEAYSFPSVTPLRFIFDIPLFLLLILFIRKGKRLILPLAFTLACAVFYNFEIGISLGLALFSFFIFRAWFAIGEKRTRMRELLHFCGYSAVSILVIAAVITLGTYFGSGQFPEWGRLIYFTKFYSAGFGALPLSPGFSLYQLVLSVYLVTLLAVAVKKLTGHARSEDALWGALALYGLLIFQYFLSRSHPNNLYVVIVPAAILFTLIAKGVVGRFQEARQLLRQSSQDFKERYLLPYYATLFTIICLAFGIIGVVQGNTLIKVVFQRYVADYNALNLYYWTYQGTGFFTQEPQGAFARAANALHKYTDREGRVGLLSKNDALLMIMSRTTNIIDAYFTEEQIWTRPELERAAVQLQRAKPKYLFIDQELGTPAALGELSRILHYYTMIITPQETQEMIVVSDPPALYRIKDQIGFNKTNSIGEIFSRVLKDYEFVSHEGVLDLYRRKSL